MKEETTTGIPTGPIDREPIDYPTPGVFPSGDRKAQILHDLFAQAGVEPGEYDEKIAHWLAHTADWSTFAVIASWVQRAGQAAALALCELGDDETTKPEPLMAACTPNSLPDAEGEVDHGFQINVLNDGMDILATIDLPDWESFRPASAGHRLIEHGYMIHPDARGPETVNGWRQAGAGWMVSVIRTDT